MLIAHVLRDKGAAIYSLSADATLQDAARELHDKRVGALVVLDEGGAIVGVLSERDIVREVAARGAQGLGERVGAIMSRNVVTAAPEESVDEGLARMTDRRVRHLPVVSAGRLVGVVSIGDLVKMRIAEVEQAVEAMQAYIAAG
ncbi:MAG: CBS domain-containing protein [Hyphomonadaceae bacterium]|nr:CBS domain-containing protein [Hyphomonadaceae bacterium]